MADITISTSRQSCKPDCDQSLTTDHPAVNKYSEIDESPSADTEEQRRSVDANASEAMPENKLKRKKKLSTSLTSVSEAVNQEKRTRIEGIQLNCRGKLNEELIAAATRSKSPSPAPPQLQAQVRVERVLARAPQPSPKVAEKIILLQQQCHQQHKVPAQQQHTVKVPPPRLKRKLEENVSIIQKLNAQTEQMRLEIAELKTHLTAERGAVRVLRAQNESENRKWKNEVKKLQTAMELMRKVKKSKEEACANWPPANHNSNSLSSHGPKDTTITNHELQRLTNEIKTLREANRTLEEKLQISNDAERRKAADLRELKDSYEIRLTQLSKSAKTEISRLLEEIKTKERNIGQLKRETQTLQKLKTNQTTNHSKKDTHPRNAAQHPVEMKKLKDIERNKNIINNNCNVTNKINTNNEKRFINTTCGEKEFHSMPHEITERILEAQNDVHAYGSKQDHQNSDSDSALSSAPPSISPQPPPAGMEPTDIWQTIRNYTKDIEKVQNELESIRKENETLQKELKLAKIQIKESEKTALEATNSLKSQQQQHQQLQERYKYLEQRENELQEETHELREQNELLEFRILELEESNDKWSLQSNTTVNNKNVWSNSGKESDDAIIFTDRSDSGVTSPHSHHHIDDRMNAISPCDLNLLDHIRTEDLRQRLSRMIKKPNIDEDDRMCLQQVLAFIQNLDVMSHDSLPSSEESSSLEYIKSRVSDYDSSSRSSDISPTLIVQKPKLTPSPVAGRIVATVLPYSSTVSTPNESPQRKVRAWNTSSLTESGVFEGDLSESSVQTQTEPEDFACLEATAGPKDPFNRIRERFEECFAKSAYTKVPVPSLPSLSPNLSDQKRIQFYKDRLDVLESKLLIYESSGDLQAKRLADRLQREIQLENLVKELRDRVDFLEVENAQLEEEKCEFEEAENDTRLRLQRLEVELEILSQRNIELEMSREALQNKLKDCRGESAILRDDLAACQTQICHLEEDRCRYKENLEFLHSAIPVLILFNVFCATTDMGNALDTEDAPVAERMDHVKKSSGSCDCSANDQALRRESLNLREEIRSLKKQIGDLNSRHTEALACADGVWEDMEKNYNDQLMASKAKEETLKQKIRQLECCLEDDSRAANEKITQLEESERELKYCLQRVSRDHREILKEHDLIREENQKLKEEYGKLKDRFEGPFKQAMEREKAQNKNLKEELGYMRRVSCEQEMHYRNELDCFQLQLDKLQKEFMQIQVTNSELKEEVCTLEKELVLLHEQKKEDLDKIRCLADEVRTKEDMCALMEKRLEAMFVAPYHMSTASSFCPKALPVNSVPSLAQELSGSPVKRIRMEEPKDLRTATKNLGTVLSSMKETANSIPSHKQFQAVANDVKKLAETLLASKSSIVEDPGELQRFRSDLQTISKTVVNLLKTVEHAFGMDRHDSRGESKVASKSIDPTTEDTCCSTCCPEHKEPIEPARGGFEISVEPVNVTIPLNLSIKPIKAQIQSGDVRLEGSNSGQQPTRQRESCAEPGWESDSTLAPKTDLRDLTEQRPRYKRFSESDIETLTEIIAKRLSHQIEGLKRESMLLRESKETPHARGWNAKGPTSENYPEFTSHLDTADFEPMRYTFLEEALQPDAQHASLTRFSVDELSLPGALHISEHSALRLKKQSFYQTSSDDVNSSPRGFSRSVQRRDRQSKQRASRRSEPESDEDPSAERDSHSGMSPDLPLPQQKDLKLCTPCACTTCPVYKLNRDVVCRSNCGCCSCPWKGHVGDRSRPAKNDRDRDHSNLSNQPNTEAYAGRTQPSAGPNSDRHAKDNNTCYDDDKNVHFDENADDDADESRNGNTVQCNGCKDGIFVDCCHRPCTADCAKQKTNLISFYCPEAVKEVKRKESRAGRRDSRGQNKLEDHLETGRNGAHLNELPTTAPTGQDVEHCERAVLDPHTPTTPTDQNHLNGDSGPSLPLQTPTGPPQASNSQPTGSSQRRSSEAIPEPPSSERIVPLLESIYEVLQTLRNDKLRSQEQATNFCSADTSLEQEALQSTPVLHLICEATPPIPPLPPDPVCLYTDNASSLFCHLDNENMALLEPPEREMETPLHFNNPRRLIPVDVDLFRVAEWEVQQLVEENPVQDELTSAVSEAEAFHNSTDRQRSCVREEKTQLKAVQSKTPQLPRCEKEPVACQKTRSIIKIPSDLPTMTSMDFVSDQSATDTSNSLKDTDSTVSITEAHRPTTAQFLLKPVELEPKNKNVVPSTKKSDIGTCTSDFVAEPRSCSKSCLTHHVNTSVADKQMNDQIVPQTAGRNLERQCATISPILSRWREAPAGLSFPATIESVQGLQPNSLFVKWKVHNLKNVAGYEIFVDGTLTNRYYSRIHRAAVICNVDLNCPHRIILCALPQSSRIPSSSSKSSITSTIVTGTCCPKINGTIWYPSVYQFEPTLSPASVFFRL